MNRLAITALLLIGAVVQTIIKPWGLFGALEMPVLTTLVIFIALHAGFARIMYAAVLAGILHDAFCPAPLGLSIPFFVLLALGVNRMRRNVFGDLWVTYVLLGLAAALLETAYYGLVFSLSGLRPVASGLLARRLAGGLLAGATVVPLLAVVLLRGQSALRFNRRPFAE